MLVHQSTLPAMANGKRGSFPVDGAGSCTSGKFRLVANALWPDKTAEHIAARTGCSVRQAKYRLAGVYQITAADLAAVINELLA